MKINILLVAFFILLSNYAWSQATAHALNEKGDTPIGKMSEMTKQWQQGGILEEYAPPQEILDKRTEFTKKFDKGNGVVDIVFAGPFHYQDASGAWQDIDLNIKAQQHPVFKYGNNENRFVSRYAENHSDGVEMQYQGNRIAFGLNAQVASDSWIPQQSTIAPTVLLNENIITYEDIYKDVDLEYDINTERIQHRMIFNHASVFAGLSPRQYVEVSEELQLPPNAVLKDNEGIITTSRGALGNIYVVVNGETIFTILQSRAWDASFTGDIYEASSETEGFAIIETDVTILQSGRILLTAKIPTSWLSAQNRVYPVVFDPTLAYMDNDATPTSNYRYPLNTCRAQRVSQILFWKSFINVSGDITEIAFYQNSNNPINNNAVEVKMKEVNWMPENWMTQTSSLTSFASSDRVYGPTNTNYTSGGSNIWRRLTLTDPFPFSNTTNYDLLIEVRFNNCPTQTSCPNQNTQAGGHSPGGQWGYVTTSQELHRWAYSTNCNDPPYPIAYNTGIEDNIGKGKFSPAVRLTISTTPSCTGWAINPTSASVPASGASNNSFTVTATIGGCTLSAVSNNSWIPQGNISYGTGGIVYYSVDQNTGTARTGTISVRDGNNITQATFTVNQAGGTSCSGDICSNAIAISGTSGSENYSTMGCTNDYSGSCRSNSGPDKVYALSTAVPNGSTLEFWTTGGTYDVVLYGRYGSCTGTEIACVDDPDGIVLNWTNNTGSSKYVWLFVDGYRTENGSGILHWNIGSICTPPTSPTSASATQPTINLGMNTTLRVTGGALNSASNWVWYRGSCGGTQVGTGTTLTVSPTATTTYYVQASACGTSTTCKSVRITVLDNPASEANSIKEKNCQEILADPIQVGTCTYMYGHTDFDITIVGGKMKFSRYYNSLNNNLNGPLGYGWSHSYNYIVVNRQDTAWDVRYPDGHIATFIPLYVGNGTSFPIYGGTEESLTKDGSGNFKMLSKYKTEYDFNSAGKLTGITDQNGNAITFAYSGNDLISIQGQGGRTLTVTNSSGRITRVSDPLGRQVNYTYDASGNLVTVVDANNGQTQFIYDPNRRMLSVINPLGNAILTNTYDSNGKVIAQKDAANQTATIAYDNPSAGYATITFPGGSQKVVHHDDHYLLTYARDELNNIIQYSYDSNNKPISIIDENNQTETRQYDSIGNLESRILPGSRTTTYAYNSFSKPIQVTDPLGKTTQYGYNSNGNLTSIHLPDNSWRYFSYNANGTLSSFTDGRSNVTTYAYNSYGDLTSVIAPNGTRTFGYDNAGRLTSSTDENGNVTQITYDNNDNILSVRNALNQVVSYSYNLDNKLISTTDKRGATTTLAYDIKGRLVSKTNPAVGTTTYAYDVQDNMIFETDENGNTVRYAYDAKGRRTGKTDMLGTTQYQYDKLGNLTMVTDASNKTTQYTYNLSNQIATITDALGNAFTFNYDANYNLLSVTDALGNATQYTYDPMRRLTNVMDANGKTTVITYDANGNMTSITDPNGNTQNFTYNSSNRLTTYADGAGNNYGYSYDGVGNVTLINKPTGAIAKTYDALNRLKTVVNSPGDSYSFSYDENDNIVSMSNSAGASSFSYDNLNRVIRYSDPFSNSVQFTYDAAGNKKSITYPGGLTVNYAYDGANNMKSVTDWLGNVFNYTYDQAGRITGLTYPNGIQCEYNYDAAGRLIEKKNVFPSGNGILNKSLFTLDANGKRVQEERTGPIPSNLQPSALAYAYGGDDRMLTDSITNYAHDNSGNRISQTDSINPLAFNFTVDNLLASITHPGGSVNYDYNPLGHRIKKTQGNQDIRYVLDLSDELSKVLQMTDANGAVQSHFIYGVGLLAGIDSSGTVQYYHFDAQHNTIALTDYSANITDTYTYDPFGVVLSHTGNSHQPFTFLGSFGVEQEAEGLYYVRARYYDALNGRFLSKDPYPYALDNPQTINRYVYSLNDPLRLFDYNGLYGHADDVISSFGSDGFLPNLESLGRESFVSPIWHFNENPCPFDFEPVDRPAELTWEEQFVLGFTPPGAILTLLSDINKHLTDLNEGRITQRQYNTKVILSGAKEIIIELGGVWLHLLESEITAFFPTPVE